MRRSKQFQASATEFFSCHCTQRTPWRFFKKPLKMEKLCYGNWVVWIAVTVVLHLLAVSTAQPGFLSISCGGPTNYTDQNNITWVPDTNYIGVGQTAYTGDASERAHGSYLQFLRYFPQPLDKSCYSLPVVRNVPYGLRIWFAVGNYNGFQNPIKFYISVETPGMLFSGEVTMEQNQDPSYYDLIFVSSGAVLYICLIRILETDDPIISAIELRTLQDGMYKQAQPGTMLYSNGRYDLGGNDSFVRYPHDNFDRVWTTDLQTKPGRVSNVSSQHQISTNNTINLPPTVVMQTGWVINENDFIIHWKDYKFSGTKTLLLLYFAELETLNMSRSFYVSINEERASQTITLVQNYSAVGITLASNITSNFTFGLVKATNSTSGPILNAFECYSLFDTKPPTYSQDIEALDAIKSAFDIKDWISDPCFLTEWEGIGCNYNSSPIRVSEINLSGRNLTGSVPDIIGLLTALVNVSLDNNHLIGHFPNFSISTSLERLYLQNNNMSGTLPDWLSQLENLKELFIQDNNFSGVIPVQLLDRPSLKLNYSGNPYLCMGKGDCNPRSSNKNKLMVVLGITLCGVLIIILGLIVAMVVYRKKFKRKAAAPSESRRAEAGPSHLAYHDYSMIMMSDSKRSRAFSLEEMMDATQNFSQKIGQGGFGSVFFGKLPQGKHIAVKVLSLSSKQGVHEFRNEVDLLSKIHHRNLVSLLGYCNETNELMLIYEHMSGGSLRDHLYDCAGSSELNWKTRIKITLDAAQGLEYLHVGCTPKIIHRDVKTANILLDNNMNGKLADFGLSKMTLEEDTHVTTVVKGTAGYLDPEYFNTQILSEKSDMYSFGVVLLEIICGRRPVDIKLPVTEVSLLRWATPYVDKDENLAEIIDKRLSGNYDVKSITCVAKLAIRCAQAEPSFRPSASEVVAELKEALKHEDKSSISISEDVIESSDFLAQPVYSSVDSIERKGMEWSDNSSNIPKEGR